MKHDSQIIPADRATISGADLSLALRRALMVTNTRATIPVLTTCRLSASDGTLSIRATDLDNHLTLRIPAPAPEMPPVLINPRLLARLAKGATGVSIAADGGAVTISADDLTARLSEVIPPEDFPAFAFPMDGDQHTETSVTESALNAALAAVAPCISTEETRYYLRNGIYMHRPDGRTDLRMVATDGHRLAVRDTGLDWPHPAMILPRRAIDILRHLTRPGGNEALTITTLGGNSGAPRIRISAVNWTLHSKTIDGTYPDYTRVIPKTEGPPIYSATLTLEALRRLPILGPGHATQINPQARTISITAPDVGTFSLPCDCAGAKPFGFNLEYLRAFARTSPDGIIRLEGWETNHYGPALIRTADPAMTQILMGLRV